MITKNNPSTQQYLFDEANKALSTYKSIDANISDIDDYFKYIKTLAEIESENPTAIDPIFTILPTDEATFDINANTREIKIPENFNKYGVGVKGDEIAEIIYFSIDRYFDAMDLATMDILVQWKYDTKNNNDIDTFLSATYKKSLTLKPGKIVFGWPITSEITEYAGNIQFSVRFYKRDEDTLIYNFGTLPAVIKIQNSLNINLNEDVLNTQIDKNSMIYNRLRNSTVVSNEILAIPSFGTNQWILNTDGELQIHSNNEAYDTLVPFVAKAGYHKDTNSGFTTHEIQYKWNAVENSGITQSYYLKAEEYNPYEIYYKLATDKVTYITETVGSEEAFVNSAVQLYVKGTQFTPNKAGEYSVTAINKGDTGKEEKVPSYTWIITGPEAPTFEMINEPVYINHADNELATINIKYVLSGNVGETVKEDNWILTKASGEAMTLTTDNSQEAYIVVTENPADTYCQTSIEGTVVRTVTVQKNNTEITNTSNDIVVYYEAGIPLAPILTQNSEDKLIATVEPISKGAGELSYQWGKLINEEIEIIAQTEKGEYTPTSSGVYFCAVINTYANQSKTSPWSNDETILLG